ncbi:MAG TPA: SDR family NAD(P)-dependent oxidoreductase, partial [Polyangia bacterium]
MSERVVIFGATSAIATEIARAYAGRGARLFLVGRNAVKLAALAAEFGDVCAGSLAADLTDLARADELVLNARVALGDIDVAVIAQGWLGDQLASERDVEEARRIFDTNLMSVVALVIPLANHFEAR